MIAAVYARKSTEQSVADEQKSVARQVEHARAYAAQKGWSVDEASIYVDDGISGAEFANRPAYMRLMAVLKPRPPFQVLVMSESSRLGREAWETGYALKQLLTAGVRVFFYLEDRECSFEHPLDKLQFSIVQAFDEMERTRSSQRAIDTAIRKARAGHVTGGRVFGYDNVEILDANGKRSHVERRINDGEAAVVRRMFELAATGIGQKRIGLQLNADGVAAPRAQQGRPCGWTQSSVHEILQRELYRGEIVWNRTRKRNPWGEKRVTARPERDWLRIPAPGLRIVPEDLWTAAHQRIAAAREQYRDATKGLRGGRPRIDSKYLLPGFGRCGCCNAGLYVSSGNHGSGDRRRRVFVYGCTAHHNKGRSICANGLRAPMEALDRAVLGSIGEILTPDLVTDVLARVRQLLEEPTAPTATEVRRQQLADELAAAERETGNLTEAIVQGGRIEVLVRRLDLADRRRQELAGALAALGRPEPLPRIDWRAVEAAARRKLADWRALLTRQVSEGRQLLRHLLTGPIRFTPLADGRRGYQFTGVAAIGGLFEGLLAECNGEWRPHRDSNPGFSLERAAS